MSLVKNISGGPLDVPLLDRAVEADETVGVPDFQADGTSPIVWPPDKWQAVVPPKAKASTAAEPKAKAATAADVTGA